MGKGVKVKYYQLQPNICNQVLGYISLSVIFSTVCGADMACI